MTTIQEIKDAGAQITGTDIRWVAKGYWEKYFAYRMYPGSLLQFASAIGSFIILIIMAIASNAFDEHVPLAYSIIMFLLFVAAAGLAIWGVIRYSRAKEEFIDNCANEWEHGKLIVPNFDAVIEYSKSHTRRW